MNAHHRCLRDKTCLSYFAPARGVLLAALAVAGLLWAGGRVASAANWYVTTNGTGIGGPGWAEATNDIQTAIDLSENSDTVWVSNGVYAAGGLKGYPSGTLLTNRIVIKEGVTVRSANNDPTNTVIEGERDPLATNGPAAVRCVYMANEASLIGFGLIKGATLAIGANDDKYGGGVFCASASATVSNCVIAGNASGYHGGGAYSGAFYNCKLTDNSAISDGGGVYKGTLYDCTLISNYAKNGAAASGATLSNCMLINNAATTYAGGAYGGILYGCTVTGNTATSYGGGTYNATLYDCTLSDNSSPLYGGGDIYSTMFNCVLNGNSAQRGGGAYNATMYNCTIVNNRADVGNKYGGGVYNGRLYNCTLSGNSAAHSGGGAYLSLGATLQNCLVYNNLATSRGGGVLVDRIGNDGTGAVASCTVVSNYSASGGGAYLISTNNLLINSIICSNAAGSSAPDVYAIDENTSAFYYCCANFADFAPDQGNTTKNPLFISAPDNNYRLSPGSPCIDKGVNLDWMTGAEDLDRRLRLDKFSGIVDMGCYEAVHAGAMFKLY